MNGSAFHRYAAWGIFLLMAAAYLAVVTRYPAGLIWVGSEDLPGEWMQFWFFMVAAAYCERIVRGGGRFRVFFGLFGLCCFAVAMEEISWGQRILHISVPYFFKIHSLQKETNLHNLVIGPMYNKPQEIVMYCAVFMFAAYGVIYPLMLRMRAGLFVRLEERGLAAPPFFLWPFFLSGALLLKSPFGFSGAEVGELVLSCAIAIMAMDHWTRGHYGALLPRDAVKLSRIRATHTLVIFFGVLVLSLGTTLALYQQEENRARMDRQLLSGLERIAKYHTLAGRWETAAELYLGAHLKMPERNSITRKLAHSHKQLGNHEKFLFYNNRVLEKDLKKMSEIKASKGTDKISLHHSLFRTYTQRGNHRKASFHLRKAYALAQGRLKKDPGSASSEYWLGKTYTLMGKHGPARDAYKRAHEKEPTKLLYRKAYFRTKRRAEVHGAAHAAAKD